MYKIEYKPMQYKFGANNIVYLQEGYIKVGLPQGIIFDALVDEYGVIVLSAPGYGCSYNYGVGKLRISNITLEGLLKFTVKEESYTSLLAEIEVLKDRVNKLRWALRQVRLYMSLSPGKIWDIVRRTLRDDNEQLRKER